MRVGRLEIAQRREDVEVGAVVVVVQVPRGWIELASDLIPDSHDHNGTLDPGKIRKPLRNCPEGLSIKILAASYSPVPLPVKYHRRCGA
jgi:hypothetical protein